MTRYTSRLEGTRETDRNKAGGNQSWRALDRRIGNAIAVLITIAFWAVVLWVIGN